MPRLHDPVPAAPQNPALLFAALGDEMRLHLVSRLCDEGPMSISRLTEGSEVTRQGITKHLKYMEGARLVVSARRGRERVWTLDRQRVVDARVYLEMVSRQWDEALERLRDFVEE